MQTYTKLYYNNNIFDKTFPKIKVFRIFKPPIVPGLSNKSLKCRDTVKYVLIVKYTIYLRWV